MGDLPSAFSLGAIEAHRRAAQMGGQGLGGLQGLASIPYRGTPSAATLVSKNPITFKEELQDEIDQWLKDI